MKNLVKNQNSNLEYYTILIGSLTVVIALLILFFVDLTNKEFLMQYAANYVINAKTFGLVLFVPIALTILVSAILNTIEKTKNSDSFYYKTILLTVGVFWAFNLIVFITL